MVISEYTCHVYVRGDNLAGVLLSDHEYPHRVAHTLITKVLDEFSAKIPSHEWPTLNEASVTFPQLNVYLAKYQNPREADAMTKIQEELDETKIILVSINFVKILLLTCSSGPYTFMKQLNGIVHHEDTGSTKPDTIVYLFM